MNRRVDNQREAKRLAKKGVVRDYGRYGILTEADIYTKADEFNAWLIQEKMLNPETLSKQKEKEIFKTFMEVRGSIYARRPALCSLLTRLSCLSRDRISTR